MKTRTDLQTLLEETIGSKNVYFQPPETVKIKYPCVIYSLEDIDNTFADNDVYLQQKAYSITVVDKNPDSEIRDKISLLPRCRFNRAYTADKLNHYVFIIYY